MASKSTFQENFKHLRNTIDIFNKNNPKYKAQMFESGGIKESTTLEEINEEFLLKNKEINILESEIYEQSTKISTKMFKILENWMYGQTSLSNIILGEHIIPNIEKAKELLKEKKYKNSFAIMQGVSLFLLYNEDIITDNEIYCDMDRFVKLFQDFSQIWKELLPLEHEELGMHNCYSKFNTLLSLQQFEEKTNEMLEDFDDYVEEGKCPRIEIFEEHQPNNNRNSDSHDNSDSGEENDQSERTMSESNDKPKTKAKQEKSEEEDK